MPSDRTSSAAVSARTRTSGRNAPPSIAADAAAAALAPSAMRAKHNRHTVAAGKEANGVALQMWKRLLTLLCRPDVGVAVKAAAAEQALLPRAGKLSVRSKRRTVSASSEEAASDGCGPLVSDNPGVSKRRRALDGTAAVDVVKVEPRGGAQPCSTTMSTCAATAPEASVGATPSGAAGAGCGAGSGAAPRIGGSATASAVRVDPERQAARRPRMTAALMDGAGQAPVLVANSPGRHTRANVAAAASAGRTTAGRARRRALTPPSTPRKLEAACQQRFNASLKALRLARAASAGELSASAARAAARAAAAVIGIQPLPPQATLDALRERMSKASSLSPIDSFTLHEIDAHLYALRSEAFIRRFRPVIVRLMEHSSNGGLFNEPVDAVALNIPEYHNVVKCPMDLGTIRARLESGGYTSHSDLAADVRLVFSNACLFNPPVHPVHAAAARLREEFDGAFYRLTVKSESELARRAAHSCSFCQGQACALCGDKCLKFDPPVLFCDHCGERMRRGAHYFRAPTGQRWCTRCVSSGSCFPKAKGGKPTASSASGTAASATSTLVSAPAPASAAPAPASSTPAPTIVTAHSVSIPPLAVAPTRVVPLTAPSPAPSPLVTAAAAAAASPMRVQRSASLSSAPAGFGRGPGSGLRPRCSLSPTLKAKAQEQAPAVKEKPRPRFVLRLNLARRSVTARETLTPAGTALTADNSLVVGAAPPSTLRRSKSKSKRSRGRSRSAPRLPRLRPGCPFRLERRRNDDMVAEPWVQCDGCARWVHQICGLFNGRKHSACDVEYFCPLCRRQQLVAQASASTEDVEMKPAAGGGETVATAEPAPPAPPRAPLSTTRAPDQMARTLPATPLSLELEARVHAQLRAAGLEDVVSTICVREVSSVKLNLAVPEEMQQLLKLNTETASLQGATVQQPAGTRVALSYPEEIPYRQRVVLLWQQIDDVDVCLFALYVQEYGADAPPPNTRRVYIAYLDSVRYLQPLRVRTTVYHEVLCAYMANSRRRGFVTANIWACPPQRGDGYIFHRHPVQQRTPTKDRLRKWYDRMIARSVQEGVVQRVTSFHEQFFTPDHRMRLDTGLPPVFAGDYWATEVPRGIKDLSKPRLKGKTKTGSKAKKRSKKRKGRGCRRQKRSPRAGAPAATTATGSTGASAQSQASSAAGTGKATTAPRSAVAKPAAVSPAAQRPTLPPPPIAAPAALTQAGAARNALTPKAPTPPEPASPPSTTRSLSAPALMCGAPAKAASTSLLAETKEQRIVRLQATMGHRLHEAMSEHIVIHFAPLNAGDAAGAATLEHQAGSDAASRITCDFFDTRHGFLRMCQGNNFQVRAAPAWHATSCVTPPPATPLPLTPRAVWLLAVRHVAARQGLVPVHTVPAPSPASAGVRTPVQRLRPRDPQPREVQVQ